MMTRGLIRASIERMERQAQEWPALPVFVLQPWMLAHHETIKATLGGSCRFVAGGTEEQRQRWRDVGFDLMEMEQVSGQETGRDQEEG